MNNFMNDGTFQHRWKIAAAVLVAAAAGFTIARLTAPARPPSVSAPKTPAGDSSAARLRIPESYLATMDIALDSVTPGTLSAEIQAPATVSSAANGQALVSAQAAGTIVRLNKRLGEQVKAGEVLALVESRDAAALAADRTVTESKAALTRSLLKREQSLFEQHVTPRQDLENAEAQAAAAEAEAARARSVAQAAHVASDGHSLAVVSPISGRITAAKIALGAFVEPNAELFRIADVRFILIEASVTAIDAARISAGDSATVTTSSGKNLAATVQSVTPTVNEQTRAATVVLGLSRGQTGLVPGEFVQVHITPKLAAAAGFVVPEDAVQSVDGSNVVFRRTADGFQVRPVRVGARSSGRVQILAGLNAGDQIAVRNSFLLKAELNKSGEEEE